MTEQDSQNPSSHDSGKSSEGTGSHSTQVEYLFRNMEYMTLAQLRGETIVAGVDSSGTRRQIMKRLRKYYRNELIQVKKSQMNKNRTERYYDFFVIIDIECTCEVDFYDYEHEIIEFPAVLVNVHTRKIEDTFRTVVRPVNNPKLTDFCIELTGITQEMVDNAPTFPEALQLFRRWMRKHGIDREEARFKYGFVTDGPWDLAKFFQMQCLKSGVVLPHDIRMFVNLRRAFVNRYCKDKNGKRKPNAPTPTLRGMLNFLGLEFEGREHSGLDDALNAAKIIIKMLDDRSELRVNEKLVLGTKIRSWQREAFPAEELPKKEGVSTENGEETIALKPKWYDQLPYKVIVINRDQFFGEEYLECESCDDEDEETDATKDLTWRLHNL